MTEHSGGHYRDTGAGPQLMPELMPELAAVALPKVTPERAAYCAYLAHVIPCAECNRRVWGCDEGKELWAAYKAVRPIPGRPDRRPAS